MDINTLSPRELYDLKEAVDKILVFGPWKKLSDATFVRPEPSRRPSDSRVSVWQCDGKCDLAAGWYYRIGFGVVGIGGVSGTVSHKTAEECMRSVDEQLIGVPDLYLVGIADRTILAEVTRLQTLERATIEPLEAAGPDVGDGDNMPSY